MTGASPLAGVRVREARPDELAAAGEVVVTAYETLDGDRHEDYLARIRDAPGRARHCPVLVAVDATGRVVGSVTYVPGPDSPYAELEGDGEAGMRMLGVAPDAARQGVGEALVRACIDRARGDGGTGLAIGTRPSMRAAHRLYERLGFMRAPGRDFQPVPGIDLLAYVLTF